MFLFPAELYRKLINVPMELQHSVEVKKQRKGVTPLLQQDHKRSDDVQFINNIKELLDMCMWSNVMVITWHHSVRFLPFLYGS